MDFHTPHAAIGSRRGGRTAVSTSTEPGTTSAAAREQLEAVTVCLRSIHPDRDIIDFFAEEGRRVGQDSDMRPTISVLRMMQRSLALALSDDQANRAHAMPIEELREFVIPVLRFWRNL